MEELEYDPGPGGLLLGNTNFVCDGPLSKIDSLSDQKEMTE